MTAPAFEERFWAKVQQGETNECWPCKRSPNNRGYCYIDRAGRRASAHRVAWELANGRVIPAGLMVCHACDNRRCCNPAHLWLGTNQDNLRDASAKKRWAKQQQTHCIRGHEFTEANTYLWRGRRHCKACRLALQKSRRAAA